MEDDTLPDLPIHSFNTHTLIMLTDTNNPVDWDDARDRQAARLDARDDARARRLVAALLSDDARARQAALEVLGGTCTCSPAQVALRVANDEWENDVLDEHLHTEGCPSFRC